MKYEGGRTLSNPVLTQPPEVISVTVVDLNLTVRLSPLVQVAFNLGDAGGLTVTVREPVGRQ